MAETRHFLSSVVDILVSERTNLIELAQVAGCDPGDFYVGTDLTGVDIRGQDLRSLNFQGANLSSAIYDEHTRVNAAFVPLDWNLNVFKSAELAPLVYQQLKQMIESGEARSLTQALRILVRSARIEIKDYNDMLSWTFYIGRIEKYSRALKTPRKERTNMTMKVYSEEHDFVISLGKFVRARSGGYNAAAMVAMELRDGRRPESYFSITGKSAQARLL